MSTYVFYRISNFTAPLVLRVLSSNVTLYVWTAFVIHFGTVEQKQKGFVFVMEKNGNIRLVVSTTNTQIDKNRKKK